MKLLISDSYRKQLYEMHKRHDWGVLAANKHTDWVRRMATLFSANTILDYGCGNGTLSEALPEYQWTNYDPGVERFSTPPSGKHDLVLCFDSLEHIEPEYLGANLNLIAENTGKAALFVIPSRAAEKTLPDGRNAHLIQSTPDWWVWRLKGYYGLIYQDPLWSNILYAIGIP